jgi:hypothetical protein
MTATFWVDDLRNSVVPLWPPKVIERSEELIIANLMYVSLIEISSLDTV